MTKSTLKFLYFPMLLTLVLALAACGAPKTQKSGERTKSLGSYEEAVEKYTKSLKHDPDSVILLTELGIAQYNLGQYDAAIDNFEHATEIQDYPKASFYLGLTNIVKGNRTAGFEMLSMFRYTGKRHVTETVRAKAKELSAIPDISTEEITKLMFEAWDEGLKPVK